MSLIPYQFYVHGDNSFGDSRGAARPVPAPLVKNVGTKRLGKGRVNRFSTKVLEESEMMITFITPGADVVLNYNLDRFRTVAEDYDGKVRYDILVHGENQEQHAVLNRLSDSYITQKLEKCEFSKTAVKVLGNINSEGVGPDPDKIEAIFNLPALKNVSEVSSFLGMLIQLSNFTDLLAEKTKPSRNVLSKNNS